MDITLEMYEQLEMAIDMFPSNPFGVCKNTFENSVIKMSAIL